MDQSMPIQTQATRGKTGSLLCSKKVMAFIGGNNMDQMALVSLTVGTFRAIEVSDDGIYSLVAEH